MKQNKGPKSADYAMRALVIKAKPVALRGSSSSRKSLLSPAANRKTTGKAFHAAGLLILSQCLLLELSRSVC
jgi:hypothetical protein